MTSSPNRLPFGHPAGIVLPVSVCDRIASDEAETIKSGLAGHVRGAGCCVDPNNIRDIDRRKVYSPCCQPCPVGLPKTATLIRAASSGLVA